MLENATSGKVPADHAHPGFRTVGMTGDVVPQVLPKVAEALEQRHPDFKIVGMSITFSALNGRPPVEDIDAFDAQMAHAVATAKDMDWDEIDRGCGAVPMIGR